jgi:hypothetical protein
VSRGAEISPSTLRRYRAERLLRQEFGGLREEVLSSVRGRLRARGVHLDDGDLEACYAQAWQGLYAAIAAGEEITNRGGWLAVSIAVPVRGGLAAWPRSSRPAPARPCRCSKFVVPGHSLPVS